MKDRLDELIIFGPDVAYTRRESAAFFKIMARFFEGEKTREQKREAISVCKRAMRLFMAGELTKARDALAEN